MKRIAILLTLALLVGCLAGCGAKADKLEAENEALKEALESAEAAAAAAEEAAAAAEEAAAAAEKAAESAAEEPAEAEKPAEKPAQKPAEEQPAPPEPPEPDAPEAAVVPAAPDSEAYINEFSIEDIVQQIRADYQAIVFDETLETIEFTNEATAFLQNGSIVNIIEYRQLDDDMDPATATVRYYYRSGEPFFVHITFHNYVLEEARLYFFNGTLLRRIINDDAPIDGEIYDEWNVYFDDAIRAYESVQLSIS